MPRIACPPHPWPRLDPNGLGHKGRDNPGVSRPRVARRFGSCAESYVESCFWGQRTCRQSHWMTERPKIPSSVRQNTGIRGSLEGWGIKRENAARSAMRTARQARRKPPRLVDKLCWNSPREKKAQEVVMPQLGQGIPKRIRTEQGGSPNCW